ncbi:hypothetical protein EVAR_81900_1 [Eumeta japonica]|uniref:Uncharacterized protein n=1 Tax=Eumeta variegata TaxID=151549 RepID=A0A4C1UWY5_EUMVA|nr:hypothetical protein EVAR_81900_1 [Eumeta japonica]
MLQHVTGNSTKRRTSLIVGGGHIIKTARTWGGGCGPAITQTINPPHCTSHVLVFVLRSRMSVLSVKKFVYANGQVILAPSACELQTKSYEKPELGLRPESQSKSRPKLESKARRNRDHG